MCKILSYENADPKMLVKLTPGVNFINTLCAHFSYKSKVSSFSLIMFGFAIFWHQNIGKKVPCKMLMKLTPGRWKRLKILLLLTSTRSKFDFPNFLSVSKTLTAFDSEKYSKHSTLS